MTKEITLAQSNILTTARYDFTMVEKRAVYFIINEVRKQFVENKGQKNLFDNLIVRMTTENLQRSDTALREVYAALKSLRRKSITFEDDEQYFEVGYINYSKHKKKEEVVEVEVSKLILPHLVELSEKFTSYDLTVAIALKTKYAQRFYEFCSQWKATGFLVLPISDLREMLVLENSYPRYAQLKERVIDVAQKELKEFYDKKSSDLYFIYTEDKKGATVKALKITIMTRENEPKEPDRDECMHYIISWLYTWLEANEKPKNKAQIDASLTYIRLNPDLIPKFYRRLKKLQVDEKTDNIPALARHIMAEDYSPQI